MTSQKPTCPECGSSNWVKIVYGYPSASMMQASEAGKIKLGGFVVTVHQPDVYCPDCETKWRLADSPARMRMLEASVGGYFGPNYHVLLDFEDRGLYWHCSEADRDERGSRKLSEPEVEDARRCLRRINPFRWLERYVNPEVMDGTSWSVELTTDHGVAARSGSNSFPKNWTAFCQFISRISGLEFR